MPITKPRKEGNVGTPTVTLGEGLAAFARRYKLSHRHLSTVCGGVSAGVGKTSADRIMRGLREVKVLPVMQIHIAQNIRHFLAELGKTEEQIELEIESIFSTEVKEMIAVRTTMPKEVQEFFGLSRDPFTSDPRNASEVFNTTQLDRLAKKVEDALNYQGFVAVLGEIGSGKTLLKKRVMDKVAKSGGRQRILWPSFFAMERVGVHAIVNFILREFDQTVPTDVVSRAAKVQRVLKNMSEDGVRVALGFDECHRLNDQTLTALKNFWELGSGGYDRYLGVVLFGQPQFEGKLREFEFREIVERLDVLKMPSLGKHAWEYVSHRIKIAGGNAEKLFETSAFKRLAAQANTPQALGNLCNAALCKAFSLGEAKVLATFTKSEDDDPAVRSVRRAS